MYNSTDIKKEYENLTNYQRGTNLRYIREEISYLNLTDFCKETGFTKSDVSHLENGEKTLSLFQIHAYKKYFKDNYNIDISVDYLMGYTDVLENQSMSIGKDLGLSGKSIKVLREWNSFKKKPMKFFKGYGERDIDTLNLLLEDWYDLDNNSEFITNSSIFSYIGKYLFSNKFKRIEHENIIRERDGFDLYNVDEPKEKYHVYTDDVMSAYYKNNILIIIDRIKDRLNNTNSQKERK